MENDTTIEYQSVFTEYDNVYMLNQPQVLGSCIFFIFQITLFRYTLYNVKNHKKSAQLLKQAKDSQ